MSYEVSLNAVLVSDGVVRVDVLADKLPVDFLGLSFHLDVDGGSFVYDKVDVAQNIMDFSPLFLAKQNGNSVFFGITLKRDVEFNFNGGKIVSFYLKGDDISSLSFDFGNPVLSVFQNGRVDVFDVVFNGGVIAKSAENLVQKVVVKKSVKKGKVVDSGVVNFDALDSERSFDDLNSLVVENDSVDAGFDGVYYYLGAFFIVLILFVYVFMTCKCFESTRGKILNLFKSYSLSKIE